MCLLISRHLLGRIYDEDLVLLLASPNAGSQVRSREAAFTARIGDQMYRWNTAKEIEEVDIGRRQKVELSEQLVYYTISRAFIRHPWYHCVVQFSLRPFVPQNEKELANVVCKP